ncbi:MAG: leucine-rich repeat protein, partial [Clostridia bacterium]|nr:leucine-rich repeat protein [Clostridia bacterium]
SNSSLSETPLKNVIVPDGVTALETFAFESCKKMEWIELPATLQTIGYEVFENCDSLKFIFYRGSIEDWAAININTSNEDDLANLRIVYNYAPETGYPGIDYTFDDGWLTLSGAGEIPAFAQGDYHYWDLYADQCDVLVVDSGITGVGAYAFENFSALEYIILYSENIAVSENAFAGCDALESIIITGAATFSAESFNAPDNALIFVDAAQNPELSQTAGIIRFTCEDKELHLIDDVSMDLYHVIDLVSALAAHYGEIAKITFGNLTLDGVPMQYIAEYDESGDPVILPIEGSALVNGEIKAARLDGTALTFNELIELIQTDGADGFLLMVSDENHPTIINPNVDIEDPDDPDEPPAPEDPEPAGVFDGIKVTFIKVYNTIVKAIKWAVTLLNKFFKLIHK